MEVYWIVPGSCVGQPKDFKDRVILLEDLSIQWLQIPLMWKTVLGLTMS